MAAGGGVLAGVAAQVLQAQLLAPRVYLAAATMGGLGLLISLRPTRVHAWPRRREWHTRNLLVALLTALCAAAFGFGFTGWRAGERLAETLLPELVGQDLILTGRVVDLPQLRQNGSAFLFEVEAAETVGENGPRLAVPTQVPRLISLSWYDDAPAQDDDAALPRSEPKEPSGAGVQAGQRWRLTARLKAAHGLVNPLG